MFTAKKGSQLAQCSHKTGNVPKAGERSRADLVRSLLPFAPAYVTLQGVHLRQVDGQAHAGMGHLPHPLQWGPCIGQSLRLCKPVVCLVQQPAPRSDTHASAMRCVLACDPRTGTLRPALHIKTELTALEPTRSPEQPLRWLQSATVSMARDGEMPDSQPKCRNVQALMLIRAQC